MKFKKFTKKEISRKAFEIVLAENKEDKRLFYFLHYQNVNHLRRAITGER